MIPEGLELAKLASSLALNKKAIDPVVLDLRKVGGPSDFFVIVSAENEPQIKAIAGEIEGGWRVRVGGYFVLLDRLRVSG